MQKLWKESYILAFGIDKLIENSVRIERIAEKEGNILLSSLDLEKISNHLDNVGITNYISDCPTHYLCNEA